jgi:WD40 repeat protein
LGGPFRGHTDEVLSVSFSPDGTRIVSGSWDSTIWLWDAATGKPSGEPFRGHTDPVSSVSFSPDGTRIVSGSQDSSIRLWNATIGQQFQEHTEIYSTFPLNRHPTTSCRGGAITSTNTWNNRTICIASSFKYALHDPAELLEDISHHDFNSTPVLMEDDGWMIGANRRLLFWVPPASREQPFYSLRTALVIPSGLEFDLSCMAHGENWSNCRDA